MNKLSLQTLNKIEEAKNKARYTGYFWFVVVCIHIIFFMIDIFNAESKNYSSINIPIILLELIFLYFSLFKFSRIINVLSPIIILLSLVVPYFYIKWLPFDFYYLIWKGLIDINIAKDAGTSRIITLALLPLLPLFIFYRGIRGSFAYHKLMKEEK